MLSITPSFRRLGALLLVTSLPWSSAFGALMLPADLGQMVRDLGAPVLSRRTAAEKSLATALGDAAGAGAQRGGYEQTLGDLRQVLATEGSSESSAGTAGGTAAGGASPGSMIAARRRLSVILGADDRLLGMAIQLAADGRAPVRAVGDEAILAQLSRWSRSVHAEPSAGAFDGSRQNVPLPGPLLERASFQVALDPNGSAPDSAEVSSGASAFDLLDRRGGAPLPIVVDPAFVERMARRPAVRLGAARIEGSWSELLKQLCVIHDGAYQLQGYRFPDEVFPSDLSLGGDDLPPARAWIHVVQRGTTQLAPLGRDLRDTGARTIVDWCRSAGAEGDLIRQGAAARALAVLGWPAAIHWLERRWAWYGDTSALEGLMAAAARGRVAPSLQDPRCLRAILDFVEREALAVRGLQAARMQALAPEMIRETGGRYEAAASALDGRLQRLALGLRELVPMLVVGDRLQPLDELLFGDFDSVSPEGKWLRLATAEGLGIESAAGSSAARGLLAEPLALSPTGLLNGPQAALLRPLRRQALRTLGVVRPPASDSARGRSAIRIAQAGDLFGAQTSEGSRDVVGLGLELGRLEPLSVDFTEGPAFDWARNGRRPEVLKELLVWAALAADARMAAGRLAGGTGRDEAAPEWVLESVKAGLRDWQASRKPDLRAVERCAVRRAARELRVLGDGALPALLAWVKPRLGRADFSAFESLTVQAGAFSVGTQSMDPDAAMEGPRRRAFEGALAGLEGSAQDADRVERSWLDLAALAADAELGSRARAALAQSLVRALGNPSGTAASSSTVVYAAESALKALREARLDSEAQGFLRVLQKAAQAADHPLGQRFRQPDWPPRPASVPRDLERVDPVRPPVFSFR